MYVSATEKLLVKRKIVYHLFPQQYGTRGHHLSANISWKPFKDTLDVSKERKWGAASHEDEQHWQRKDGNGGRNSN